MTTTPRKLCLWHLSTLDKSLTLDSGEVLPAGTAVMLVPQTTAHSVLVGNGKSLAELLPTIATSLADYSAQLIRYADRQTQLESQQAKFETWARANGYTGV
ncbi:MAG: hypothetical protein RR014_00390 [Bilophila sp.]